MSSVDSRIVTMKFDNAQFEKGASTTMGTLDKLKKALQFDGASKGLTDVQAAANSTNFGPLHGSITGVSKSFVAMSTIAITALSNLTTKAMAAGAQIIKSLTLQPVTDGFKEYELKMGSIQTILANTAKYGTTTAQVTAELDKLNEYADKTIYNFGEMTRNAGLFTNSGMRIEEATTIIKGFSNAAAASGTDSQGAARAAYQLSQAFSAGTIRLMDWKSLTNVGMGNKNMQTSLIEIGDAMGAFEGKSIDAKTAADDFNGSLEKKWLTKDVMQTYLSIMANEVTPAQMKAIGLSEEQIKKLQQEAKTAEEAATKVRTMTQLFGTLKEAIGSGWAASFGIVLGDFDEATELFSGISDALSGFVNKSSEARNKILQDWKDLGGRDALISGLKKAMEGLNTIVQPIVKAFREIFPATTGKQLYDLTVKFKEFADRLKIGSDTADKLRETFKGVFAIFSIIGQVVKGAIGVLLDLFGAVGKGSGGFLTITASIGKFISGIDSALKNGDGLQKFFEGLSSVLQIPIKLIQLLAGYLIQEFSGFDPKASDAITGSFDRMADRAGPLANLLKGVMDVISGLSEQFKAAIEYMQPFIDALQRTLGSIGSALKEAFSGADLKSILDLINTGLFAALIIMVKKFLKDFKLDFGGGVIESIKDTFGAVTGTLQTMQQNLKANILLKIAGALALLTASIVTLSLIDSDKLTKAMVAISAAFGELVAAMAILTKMTGMTGYVKLPFIVGSMIVLAGAILILSFAISKLSKLDWNGLAKGLVGVGGSLAIMIMSLEPLSKISGGMFTTGLALIAMAIGLNIMASAIGKFAKLPMGDIAKGLGSVVSALIIIIATMSKMPKDLPMLALGLLGIAVAMNVMASAIAKMGELDILSIVKGLIGIAGAMSLIALSLGTMPPNMVWTAIALVGVSIALTKVADAIVKIGTLSWSEVARGLTTLAGALVILGVAMTAMDGALTGAMALTALSIALSFLVPALKALGNLSWKEIIVGLIALAGAFTVLGVAAYLIGPLSVVVLALAASLALLGAAVALTGFGMLAFAKAIEIIVNLGTAAAEAIGLMLGTLMEAIPKMMNAFAEGIVQFTKTIVQHAPEFVKATIVMLNGILDTINTMAPKITETMGHLLDLMLDYIIEHSPKIVNAGFKLITDFMAAIRDNIYQIVTIAADIMTKFMKGIGDKSAQVADEGAKTVIKLINAIADAIRNNSKAMNEAGKNLSSAIVEGFIGGITSGASGVVSAIVNMAKGALNAAKNILGIHSPSKEFETLGMFVNTGFANGIRNYSYLAERSVDNMGSSLLNTMKVSIQDLNAMVDDEMNSSPVIAPVLDLSNVRSEASKIDSLVQTKPNLTVDISKQKANSIANDRQVVTNATIAPVPVETQASTTIKFEQNNYSPKALSEVELYRQTRNQLALAKGALTK